MRNENIIIYVGILRSGYQEQDTYLMRNKSTTLNKNTPCKDLQLASSFSKTYPLEPPVRFGSLVTPFSTT